MKLYTHTVTGLTGRLHDYYFVIRALLHVANNTIFHRVHPHQCLLIKQLVREAFNSAPHSGNDGKKYIRDYLILTANVVEIVIAVYKQQNKSIRKIIKL